jgi:hypothetical protein
MQGNKLASQPRESNENVAEEKENIPKEERLALPFRGLIVA